MSSCEMPPGCEADNSYLMRLKQSIEQYQSTRPGDRTFKIIDPLGAPVWIKQPDHPRLRFLYSLTNRLMVCLGMPYFQAPPHAGAPGGKASLSIEKEMLIRLKTAGVPVPDVKAYTEEWLVLSSVGEENLDVILNQLPSQQRLPLWQQAATAIAHVHQKNCFLSQSFARNILLKALAVSSCAAQELTKKPNEAITNASSYELYFLDFEEDPTKVMTQADAQVRDWAMFLHSTAALVNNDMAAAQSFYLNLLKHEPAQTQIAAKRLFKQLKTLRFLKNLQWIGRDAVRLYQLGQFAQGIYLQLTKTNNT